MDTLIIVLCVYVVVMIVFTILFWKRVFHNIARYIHRRIKGVHRVESIQSIEQSIRDGSVYFEKQYVEFYTNVLRRISTGYSVLIARDDDLRWFVKTDEKENSGHTLYHENKNYRFRLYIEKIEYNADDNEGKGEYTVWSKMV